jgi:uncharacterized protein (UPF0335 family)
VIESIGNLERRKRSISDNIRKVYAMARNNGLDTRAIRKAVSAAGRAATSSDSERLGSYFRHYREAAGLTLHELADKMELSVNTIRLHEGGERLLRVPELWRAAKIFGVTYDKLLDPDSEPEG